MRFVFWYWKEHPNFEPKGKLDFSNWSLVNYLKKHELSYTVYQYIKNRDKEFIEFCQSLKNQKIIYFVPEECRLFLPDYLKKIYKILQKNNCTLEIWLGNFEEEQGIYTIGITVPNDRIFVINWNTLMMYRALYHYKYNHKKVDCSHIEIDKSFVCLNNRLNSYRCKMMETLAKNNLIDEGYVSWLKLFDDKIYDEIFQYFNNKPLYLDDKSTAKGMQKISQKIVEEQYFRGFVNIISEGEIMFKDISEKTFYAILHKKPFLILGAPNIHRKLQDLGFILYDSLFDYSFDTETEVDKRINGIVENLKSIRNKNYNQLYEELLPILDYNYDRYIEILKDKEKCIPHAFFKYLNSDEISRKEQNELLQYHAYTEIERYLF